MLRLQAGCEGIEVRSPRSQLLSHRLLILAGRPSILSRRVPERRSLEVVAPQANPRGNSQCFFHALPFVQNEVGDKERPHPVGTRAVYEYRAVVRVGHELPESLEGLVIYVLVTYGDVHVFHTCPPDRLRFVEPAILTRLSQVDHGSVAGFGQRILYWENKGNNNLTD